MIESEHRGHVVEVDQAGSIRRVLGDPERVVLLRSTAKPFGVVALIEAGGIEAYDLSTEDLALMASSHSGEDVHVRTLAALYRRAGVSQAVLAPGTDGMPLDALTAARLARDGERAGPLRHMCSGQHTVMVLLSKLRGWPLETYWEDGHPAQVEYRRAVARAFAVAPERMPTAIDGCGVPTYAFPLSAVARAYAFLADPAGVPAADPRAGVSAPLARVRDAMLAHPDLVGGSRDRLDTSLMKAVPGRLLSKIGMEALRAVALLPGARAAAPSKGRAASAGPAGGGSGAAGIAIKLEDGAGHQHAAWAASVEALAQAGVLEGQALRVLARYHRPATLDPHGRAAGEAVAQFDLAPVGELIA